MSGDAYFLLQIVLAAELGYAGVFWALYAWARAQPDRGHVPALVGLILYAPAVVLRLVVNPMMVLSLGTAISAAILLALLSAVRAGYRYQRLKAAEQE